MEWHYTANIETPLLHNALKYLLARRLVRNEDWDKAIEYMPTNFKRWWYEKDAHGRQYEDISPRGQLKKLYGYLQKTKNKRLSNKERAMNYYEAALIMRKYGMELVGTELDPDWFVFNGQFAYDDTAEQRFGIMNEERQKYYKDWYDEKIEQAKIKRKEIEKERNFFAGSKDEEERVLSSLPKPAKRFHYRYKASDLMWKAAMLLPDNNELKSKALCIGGSYIKIKDPETADKFYKTLVKTCAQTKLGKEAANLHWFPKIETEE